MSRRAVVEVRCERCKRVEYRDAEAPVRSFLGILRIGDQDVQPARDVEFEELCEPCWQTIITHLDQIGKAIKGRSPKRRAKEAAPQAQGDRLNGADDD